MGFHSIRARLITTLTLATALLMLLICGGLSLYTRYIATDNSAQLLRSTVEQIRSDLVESNGTEEERLNEALNENLNRLQSDNLVLAIYRKDGKILRQSQDYVPALHEPNSRRWRVREAEVQTPKATYFVAVGQHWSKIHDGLEHQTLGLMVLGLMVTGLSALGTWWLVGRTLHPIHALSLQARSATAEDLQLRLEVPSRDSEIVELVTTLNGLLERVSSAVAGRSRFYAAASHELRTPLYVLSGSLEVALSRDRDREEYREALQVASSQARQLIELVRGLLMLNQLDFMPAPPTNETIDLPDLVYTTLASLHKHVEERHLNIEVDLPRDDQHGASAQNLLQDRSQDLLGTTTLIPDAASHSVSHSEHAKGMVEAHRAHLEMLVRNLIENALLYTPEGGHIFIGVATVAKGVVLTIRNDYPGAAGTDCSSWFEPFYRPEHSRKIYNEGNGLGLAICSAITRVNGWDLKLGPEEREIVGTVLFPAFFLP